MGTDQDHRKCAEHCVEKAQAADDERDKVLWLTLAASWLRLAELAGGAAGGRNSADDGEDALAVHASD
jgi:hypothetical protein